MRHRHSRLRLRQKPAHANSLVRNLATSVLLYETVRTTKKRAEVAQPVVEKLITIAKTKTPHVAIRAINQVVTHKNACRKTMEVLKDRFSKRSSGYTRIVPLGSRAGDGAKLVSLELVDRAEPVEQKVEKKEKKAPKADKKNVSTVKA